MDRYFEWDDRKAEGNFRKHGIRFEEAAQVFDDPLAVSVQDRIENVNGVGKPSGWPVVNSCCWWRTRCNSKPSALKWSGSSARVAQTERNGGVTRMARYKQGELPPLTEQRKAELAVLAEQPDSEIDYSDIPPLDESFWARAVPNPFFKPVKTHASVRIDADVLAWLKSQGKGYQTRMNAILREAMLRSQGPTGARSKVVPDHSDGCVVRRAE